MNGSKLVNYFETCSDDPVSINRRSSISGSALHLDFNATTSLSGDKKAEALAKAPKRLQCKREFFFENNEQGTSLSPQLNRLSDLCQTTFAYEKHYAVGDSFRKRRVLIKAVKLAECRVLNLKFPANEFDCISFGAEPHPNVRVFSFFTIARFQMKSNCWKVTKVILASGVYGATHRRTYSVRLESLTHSLFGLGSCYITAYSRVFTAYDNGR